MESKKDWQRSDAKVFWGEIAPCDHVLQIYETDDAFLDLLTSFVSEGINAHEGVIVIATDNHLQSLKARLTAHGLNVEALIASNKYVPLNAEDTLSKFMRDGWPDEQLFMTVIGSLIRKVKKSNNKIRAFGEMVAILWAEGNSGATVNLEHLWNKFCEKEAFCLFCAYPKTGFTQNSKQSMLHICKSHSRMISGGNDRNEVLYKIIQSDNLGELTA